MLTYRKDIDGLRALAIIPVVLFHANHNWIPGGFLGVDVFFVISGFLITGLLMRDMDAGSFRYRDFFARRVRRLLPAALFMMLIVTCASYYLMTPGDLEGYAKSLIAQTYFGSNFHFARQDGYFATDTELEPLLHMWSLAVEEQFYLVLPPLLLWLTLHARQARTAMIAVLMLASFALCVWQAEQSSTNAFYLLPARAWELLAGGMAAHYVQHRSTGRRHNADLFSGTGLILILASYGLVDSSLPHPSWPTLLPVAGTVLVLAFGQQSRWVSQLLSLSPLVGIGLISYSLYLWHQPIFALPRHVLIHEPRASLSVLLALASLVMAVLSWITIERRFRYQAPQRLTLQLCLAATLLLLCAGLLVRHHEGHTPFNSHYEFAKRHLNDLTQDGDPCHSRKPGKESPCIFPATRGNPTLYLVGDSHLGALAPQLHAIASQQGIGLVDLTLAGCHFARKFHRPAPNETCSPENQELRFQKLLSLPPGIVVLHGRLPRYLSGKGFENQGIHEDAADAAFVSAEHGERSPHRTRALQSDILGSTRVLQAHGHRILIIYPVPEMAFHVPSVTYRLKRFGLEHLELGSSLQSFKQRASASYALYDAINGSDTLRIYPEKLLCDTATNRCDAIDHQGRQLYFDDNHLSKLGATRLARQIILAVMEKHPVSSTRSY